jgi:hypothetical protein
MSQDMPAQMANRLKKKPGATSIGVSRMWVMEDEFWVWGSDDATIGMHLYLSTTKWFKNPIKMSNHLGEWTRMMAAQCR